MFSLWRRRWGRLETKCLPLTNYRVFPSFLPLQIYPGFQRIFFLIDNEASALCASLTRLRREPSVSIRKKYPLEPRVLQIVFSCPFSSLQPDGGKDGTRFLSPRGLAYLGAWNRLVKREFLFLCCLPFSILSSPSPSPPPTPETPDIQWINSSRFLFSYTHSTISREKVNGVWTG